MNVLILVFTMLALLTIMTYTRLQTFLDYAGVRIEYKQFMENTERQDLNKAEERKYKSAKPMPKAKKTDEVDTDAQEEEPTDKDIALSKLNVSPLVAPNVEDAKLQASREITSRVFRRLLDVLYSKQEFYQEALKENTDLVGAIMNEILDTAQDPPCELKFTNVKDLANFPFRDPKLREVFYQMLKGAPAAYAHNSKGEKVKVAEGYPSLYDYLAFRKKETKIRVWLAKRGLLEALYRDPSTVERLMETRSDYYNRLKGEFISAKDAQSDLQDMYGHEGVSDIDPQFLDFSVSKTKPPTD